nr:hypothetical protein [Klebsormidium nitens]
MVLTVHRLLVQAQDSVLKMFPPNMPRSASEPELHSLQSRFGSGTALLQKKKRNPGNNSVTIRAAGSERSVPIEVEVGQLAIPVIKEVQEMAKKVLERDIMIVNINEILTDPDIRSFYKEAANKLIDCRRNIDKEFIDLQDGLETFCDYRNVTESTEFSNEVKMLIVQKFSATEALLTKDFKKRDSPINKFKYRYLTADKYKYGLSAFPDAGKWPTHKRERYILIEQAKERVWFHLKVLLADDIKALLIDFSGSPPCYLSLQVYSYAPMYLADQRAKIETIFSDKLNPLISKEKRTQEEGTQEEGEETSLISFFIEQKKDRFSKTKEFLLKRKKLPEQNFWKNKEQYRKACEIYKSTSVRFVKEAEAEAMKFLNNENESLVEYYNQKNPEQVSYAKSYEDFTGLEPIKPTNRRNLACLIDASSTAASASSTDEGRSSLYL